MRINFKLITSVVLVLLFCFNCGAQNSAEKIKLNQIGYYPSASKIAVAETETPGDFYIRQPGKASNLFTGKLSAPRKSEFSEKKMCIADFSSFTKEGSYILVVPDLGQSYPFEIKKNVHDAVSKAAIKGFYYQRMSTALPEKFAGIWNRPFAHPDTKVLVHGSAASDKRPEGTELSSPRGWYDAGDYNKYIVNSGITMGTLLSAYEEFPAYYDKLKLDIPESSNKLPDIIDETLWNLRWMLTMQDPNDGGVYHKLTNAKFDGMVMPHEVSTTRYVVQKGAGAALDFAAVMAQASRILKKFNKEIPGLADSCLNASKRAWTWASQNPNVIYDQNAINKQFDPDIVTGAYGDRSFTDEFFWAASELYATTKDDQYLKAIDQSTIERASLPSWGNVDILGHYTLIRFEKELPQATEVIGKVKQHLKNLADKLIEGVDQRSYMTVMGGSARDFIWGSSSVAANQAIILIETYRMTGDKKYLNYALTNLDYLLGRNATGYSFVTGHGDKTPMHIHHRQSEADGIAEPVPGLLSGGPNPGKQDRCTYASSVPNEAFVDDVCSYASNEIAINWNAPLVYLVGAMEVTMK